jgi:tRNA 2-thiouridine synthesizing protein E
MNVFNHKNISYETDSDGFLVDSNEWDENFAEGAAAGLGIPIPLTKEHWDIIRFVREAFKTTGRCPLVYEVCRMNGLRRRELQYLFPCGYWRGVCKIAGMNQRTGFLGQAYLPTTAEDLNVITANKIYTVDLRGFLINPDEWDEYYAVYRAYEDSGRQTDGETLENNQISSRFLFPFP